MTVNSRKNLIATDFTSKYPKNIWQVAYCSL